MRLLFLIHSDEPGGAETVFLQLVTGLAHRGHEVTVGIAGDGWLRARLAEAGVEVTPLRFRGPGDAALLRAIVRLIRERRPDVVQCFMSRMNLYGSVAAAVTGVPVVTSVRGPEGPGRWGRLPEWLVGRLSTRIVTVSRELEQGLAGRLPAGKLVTIANGVDLARFGAVAPDERSAVRAAFGVPECACLVGTVGRLDPVKRVDDLIEAVALRQGGAGGDPGVGVPTSPRPLYALIVGDGVERQRLTALATERGVGAQVLFAGMREDVPRILAAIDLFVLASGSEGQPNAILEAMAAARPVVATDVGGVRELVVHGETGLLVPAGDPAALAAAIGALQDDPATAKAFGEAGARRAASRFGRERMVAEYEAVYQMLAALAVLGARVDVGTPTPGSTPGSVLGALAVLAALAAPGSWLLAPGPDPSGQEPGARSQEPPLIVCVVAPSLDAIGGQAVQAAALVQGLETEGVRVRHVAPDARLPSPVEWVARIRGLRTVLRLLRFTLAVRRAAREADLLHVFTASYASFLLTVLPSFWASRRFRRPLVLHYHSGEAPDHLRRQRRLVVPLLRRADRIVVPSGYLAELFASYGLRASVIPNILAPGSWLLAPGVKGPGQEPGGRYADPGRSQAPRLLCTRNLEPLYDVATVLEAFARVQAEMPGASLTLAGSGSEEGRLRRMARLLKLQNVRFLGAVAHEAMPAVYQEADLWVNASRVDNMPVSMLEAFASGLPVVSTNAGGIPWLVRDGVTGLLVPCGDPAALASAILRVLRDPVLAADLASAGRREAARHTWDGVRDLWLGIYRSVGSRQAPGSRLEGGSWLLAPGSWPEGSGPGARSQEPGAASAASAARSRERSERRQVTRLLAMGPAELWERSAQVVRAHADARNARRRVGYPVAEQFLARSFPAIPPEERSCALAKAWRDSPFWFEHAERSARAALLGERLSEMAGRVIRVADAAVGAEVELFGHVAARVSDPCDWHRCPVTGRVWPRVPWREIDCMPGNPIGDVKFVWELNRHAHFLALGQAAALTGDPCYGQALSAQMVSWLAQNPPGLGVHWCSSLEVALRSLSWLWATRLAMDSPGFEREAEIDSARLLWCSGRHLSRFLSTYSSPNTHLLGETLLLWTLGVALPWLPEAGRWRRRGWARFCAALLSQIRPDGGHGEQSTSYHRYALEMGLLALTLAERTGEPVPDAVRDRVAAAAGFAERLTGPDGLLPPLGDCDGGATLPLLPRDPHDARGWLAVAKAVGMGTESRRCDTVESLWTVGTARSLRSGLLAPGSWLLARTLPARSQEPGARSQEPGARSPETLIYPATGLAVMRGTDCCLVFDAGPHGFGRAGHGHADALSIELTLGGERVLVDPGTFQYGTPPAWRDAFRSAAAHNTILVDGIEPAMPEGPFAWATRVDGRLEATGRQGDGATGRLLRRGEGATGRRGEPGAGSREGVPASAASGSSRSQAPERSDIEWVEGSHDGYRHLEDPVRLTRRVGFCRGEYWVIEDHALGCTEHVVEVLFHLAAGASVERDPSGGVRVVSAAGRVLWLIPLDRDGLTVEVATGETEPPFGWVSPRYGERVAAPVVRCRVRRVAPFRNRTLLLPAARGASAQEIRKKLAGVLEAWGAERLCVASVA
jgi:glycosyltransferase involved in cell wall biosynthesis